jgi:hypothetical protein
MTSRLFQRILIAGKGRPAHQAAVSVLSVVAIAALMLFATADRVKAGSFAQGVSAFSRQDYGMASRIFIPLADPGGKLQIVGTPAMRRR